MADLTYWLTVFLALPFFEFTIYLQHVMGHAVSVLWRRHHICHSTLEQWRDNIGALLSNQNLADHRN